MGQPKGLLELDGASLLRRHVDGLQPVCDAVAVVLGSQAGAHAKTLPNDVSVLVNPAWHRSGPSDSLRVAVNALALSSPCFVTPVDVLPAKTDTLRALLQAGAPSVPTHAGDGGHPVLVDGPILARIAAGPLPGGLRTLLASATRVEVDDPSVPVDFDTPDAFLAARRLWRNC